MAHVLLGGLDDVCRVDGDEGHHLQRVRRLRVGERVTAADGDGRWRAYEVSDSSPGCLGLAAAGPVREEPRPRPGLAVAFALTKGGHPELVVQKLTELGVDRILPVTAARSVARWQGERATEGVGRLRRVVRAAAAQCRRARLPEVEDLAPLCSLAGHPAVVVADRAGDPLGALAPPAGGEWLVVVGPEGGVEASEVEALSPVATLRVGPHVLRAETAALAVAAALTTRRV
ncbi:MAG: 16S rRNA (uracil(1498)-N(3))-methyltransferase [Acidimicrobiia bacterium]|nr:16S rRNA (uracil(1498)-N(3))-methyltransferase [Acidimicrobiia bacterium]